MPSLQQVNAGTAQTDTKSLMNSPQVMDFTFTDKSGNPVTPSQSASSATTKLLPNTLQCISSGVFVPCPCRPGPTGVTGCPISPILPPSDADLEGLLDTSETQLTDSFTPVYSISAGEQQQFTTFQNYVPMTVASLVGPDTPFSYYRVSPVGVGLDRYGNQRAFCALTT